MGMFHEILIDLREYRLRRRRLKWSRLYYLPELKKLWISFKSITDSPRNKMKFIKFVDIETRS